MTGRRLLALFLLFALLPAVVSADKGRKKRDKNGAGTNWTNLDGSKGLPTDPVKAKAELERVNALMATLPMDGPLLAVFERRKKDLEAVAGVKATGPPDKPKPDVPKPDAPPEDKKDIAEALQAAGWNGGSSPASPGSESGSESGAETEAAQARADASVERARSGGGTAKHALSGAEAWKRGGDPGPGGTGPGAGRPVNVSADPDLQRAVQGGSNESLKNFGYKVGAGPSIVHADGRRPTGSELAGLAEDMRKEPRALERRPDFFSVIPRESYGGLQRSYSSRSGEKEFKHVGSDGRDFKWKESCALLGGGCNESAAKPSYKRDDFVDPETLRNIADLMRELDANPASTPPHPYRKPPSLSDVVEGAARASAGTAASGGVFASAIKVLGLRTGGPPLPLSVDAVRSGGWIWLLAAAAAALGFVLRRRAGAGRPEEDSGRD